MLDKKRLKVAYLVSTLERTGPTNQLCNLITNLDKNIFEPVIVTLSPEPPDSMMDRFVAAGIQIFSLKMSRTLFLIKGPLAVRKYFRQNPVDIIHSISLRGDIVSAFFLLHVIRCSTRRSTPFENYRVEYGNIRGTLLEYFHLTALAKLDEVVFVSNAAAISVPPNRLKYSVIINGVDEGNYKPASPAEKTDIRLQLALPLDKFIFVFVGKLCDRKNPLMVIDAFQKSGLDERSLLIILGDGPLSEVCIERIGPRESIILKGNVNTVADYLRASDAFVSSALSEAMPNSVMEAMASGLPVILSDIQPHREILNFHAGSGEFYPIGSTRDLIRLFKLFASDPSPRERSIIARSVAEEFLGARRMSLQYQKMYLDLFAKETQKKAADH
jgi:glycosyltransferase involved in cell wall biosynthesis